MIEFHFFGMPIKTLGSLGKIRVGRVTGNTHFFGLSCLHLPTFRSLAEIVFEKSTVFTFFP